ncbi:unnamed protein product, partial [Ectocarpus sp. 4 AP-2014]
MNSQRQRVYTYRQQILDGANCRELLLKMIGEQLDEKLDILLDPKYGVETFAKWAGGNLGADLEPRDFRNLAFGEAERLAHDEAERQAEAQVFDAIEENLPENDEEDWNWAALAKWANARFGINVRDRDLKKIGRDHLSTDLIEKANAALAKINLSQGGPLLEPRFGIEEACGWMRHKFGVEIDPPELVDLEPEEVKAIAHQRTEEAYDAREAEYPVLAAMYRFGAKQQTLDREGLVEWACRRFNIDLSVEDL